MKIIENSIDKNSIHIYSVDINVIYSVYGQLLQLSQGTTENNITKLSLLDAETDTKEGSTSIEFSNIKELDKILIDFNNKFNNSKK